MGNKTSNSKQRKGKINEDPEDNPIPAPSVYNFGVKQSKNTPYNSSNHDHADNQNITTNAEQYADKRFAHRKQNEEAKSNKIIMYQHDRLGNPVPIQEEAPKPLITMRKSRKEGQSTIPENPSGRFYKICKKCKKDSVDEDKIIDQLDTLIRQYGVDSIDVNYQNVLDDYAMKYVIKYVRPNVLQYIIDQFVDSDDEKNKEGKPIDLYIIDNREINNNVIHYMIQEMGGYQENDALDIINILFDNKYEDVLDPHGLLYQYNDYHDTPIDYCRKRKFIKLTKKLETIKYVHIHDLLIEKCKIPYDISHCIVGFVFVVVHAKNLEQLRDKWDVMVSPGKY